MKNVTLSDVTYKYSQDSDSCDSNTYGQCLTVKTEDGGGGPYIVIETSRWAIDADEIDQFVELLKSVLVGINRPSTEE